MAPLLLTIATFGGALFFAATGTLIYFYMVQKLDSRE
jgi:hypothetical protein